MNHLATWLYIAAKLIDAAYCDAHEQDAVQAMAILQRPTTSYQTRHLFYTACSAWSAWRALCEAEEEVRV
jgi:hypothetical protein